MKKISLCIVLCLATGFLFSQRIVVRETTEKIGGGTNNAFVVQIFEVNQKEVEKEFKKYLKTYKAKLSSSRGEIIGRKANIASISDRPVNVFVKISSTKDNSVELTAAFDLGGAFLSSGLHSSQADRVKEILRNFSRDLTSSKYNVILKEQEQEIKKLEKQFNRNTREKSSLEKENKNLKSRMEDNEKKIERLDKDIKEQEKDLKEKKDVFENKKKEAGRIR